MPIYDSTETGTHELLCCRSTVAFCCCASRREWVRVIILVRVVVFYFNPLALLPFAVRQTNLYLLIWQTRLDFSHVGSYTYTFNIFINSVWVVFKFFFMCSLFHSILIQFFPTIYLLLLLWIVLVLCIVYVYISYLALFVTMYAMNSFRYKCLCRYFWIAPVYRSWMTTTTTKITDKANENNNNKNEKTISNNNTIITMSITHIYTNIGLRNDELTERKQVVRYNSLVHFVQLLLLFYQINFYSFGCFYIFFSIQPSTVLMVFFSILIVPLYVAGHFKCIFIYLLET